MVLSEKGKPTIEILTELEHRLPTISSKQEDNFVSLPFHGKSRESVLESLQQRLSEDLTYASGKILGAMTTLPHEFARQVYSMYLDRNLGDPGLVPKTHEIEQEVIHILGSLLHNSNVSGNMVSGGTEANLMAMLIAKKLAIKIKDPEIVVPESAHCSFDKAGELMGLKIKKAILNPDLTLNIADYESQITENTIALVGIAGTTGLGLIDPLESIAKLANKYNLFFHVDGAFGGFVLPFLQMLGHEIPKFDFSLKEVCSYTIDPHKMAMGVIPGGAILVKEQTFTDYGYSIPYLAGGAVKSLTILGTRPGAGAISFWALLQHLGNEGYKQIVKQCWDNTIYMQQLLSSISKVELVTKPTTNVLGIRLKSPSTITIDQLDFKLRQKGWALGLFRKWGFLRCVLMPHIQKPHIDAFVKDLKEILSK